MRHALTLATAFGAVAVGMVSGCGSGPRLAKVSGVVKLDGKPYPNALVNFQPVGGKANENPGKGSVGRTDAQGRYVLMYDGTTEGAVVGKHLVRITVVPNKGVEVDPNSVGSPDGEVMPKGVKTTEFDPFPLEWNEKSTKTFDVTADGTDKADFDVTSAKPSGKRR
jgi:hypothetical protein